VTTRQSLAAVIRRPWAVVLVATVLALGVVGAIKSASNSTATCRRLFIPAYFYAPAEWARADKSGASLGFMILDISGVGAGSAPDPHFQALARKARSAGVTLLGYASTADADRPASAVEADVRNYKAWYGVTDIFLDRVSGFPEHFGYYSRIADYIRKADPGRSLWMNIGVYPQDRQYTSIADVLGVFEGTYAQYRDAGVPAWAGGYAAGKFAYTVYAASKSELANALALAVHRRAGHVYVTDGAGSNPYSSLPSYWAHEISTVAAECSDPSSGASQPTALATFAPESAR
jgi:Spherulation-specific family 4